MKRLATIAAFLFFFAFFYFWLPPWQPLYFGLSLAALCLTCWGAGRVAR